MNIDEKQLIARILPFLPSTVEPKDLRLAQLHGDASNRIYYRLSGPDGSWLVMKRPPNDADSPSEEISKERPNTAEYSFVNMQRYLSDAGMAVPRIFGKTEREDLILLQDLGDQTLEKEVKRDPKKIMDIYQQAIDQLVRWQTLKRPTHDDCVGWKRRFDADLFEWEFDHFLEWGLEKGLDLRLPAHERDALTRVFREIVAELMNLPTCLCHRDYQSRNLMLFQGSWFILDFQDALVGPVPYDLVALLQDSYIELDHDLLEKLRNAYLARSGTADAKGFRRSFDLQTVQRKLKDGGRFHYIHLYKKNPNFLPHVPTSYRHVRRALENLEYGKFILPILGRYLREFAP